MSKSITVTKHRLGYAIALPNVWTADVLVTEDEARDLTAALLLATRAEATPMPSAADLNMVGQAGPSSCPACEPDQCSHGYTSDTRTACAYERAHAELDDLRHRLAFSGDETRALRDVAYIANGIVGAGLLDGRQVKDDLVAALVRTDEPGSLFTSDERKP